MLAAAASTSGTSPGEIILGLVMIIVGIALYWLPSFLAWRRGVRNLGSVVVINFFGFFVVTWIVALAMALADPARREA